MTPPIVAIVNQAGGVGKTTLARDLGYELSRRFACLVIDGDTQGSLGEFLGLNPHEQPVQDSFWDAVANETSPTVREAFGMSVGIANQLLFQQRERIRERYDPNLLFRTLQTMNQRFDLILLDCPPDINEVTLQILQAADWLLIPVQTEAKAVWGFDILQTQIARANNRRKGVRPPLQVLGLVPTLFRADRKLHKHYLDEIKRFASEYDYDVLAPVRNFIAVTEACNFMKPLRLHSPNCPALDDILAVCSRMEMKLNLSDTAQKQAFSA